VLLALALSATQWGATVFEGTPAPAGTSSTTAALFGPYLLAFEIASVLILAAVIGGVYLATAPKPGDDEGDEVVR
jgi:NADH:ubiquinone oxidoreductase subunit 6 (subunit J)